VYYLSLRNSCWGLRFACRILNITLLEDNESFTDSDVRLVLNMLTGGSTGYTTLFKFLSKNWEKLRQRYVHLNGIPNAVTRGNVWKLYFDCMVNCFCTVCGSCPLEILSVVLWTARKLHIHSFILKLNQQDATLYNIRLFLSVLYMFPAGFLLIIRSSKIVHAASGTCQTCMEWPLAWVSQNSDSHKLAVTAYKSDKYPMLHVQFLSSWWWVEKPLETCRALTAISEYCITLHLVGWA